MVRYKPLTNQEKGIEKVFEERKLDLHLFRMAVKGGLDNTAIANLLNESYKDKYGFERQSPVIARTIKAYRKLL